MNDMNGLDFVVGLLQQLGLYPVDDDESNHTRHVLPGVMLVFTVYNVLVQCVNIYLTWGDVELITEHAMAFLLYTFIIIKMGVFFDDKNMVNIVRKIQMMNKNISTDHNREMYKMEDRINVNVMRLGMASVMSCSGIGLLGMFVVTMATGRAPFHHWYPIDPESSLVFGLYAVILSSFTHMDILYIVACDMALTYTLQNLRAITEETLQHREPRGSVLFRTKSCKRMLTFVGELMADRIPNYTFDVISDEDSNPDTDETDRGRGLLRTSIEVIERQKESKREAYLECKTNKEMEKALGSCVVHHQQLIALTKDINSTFSDMLVFQVITNALNGLLGLYISALAISVDVKVMVVASCIFVTVMELFIFCWYADQLTSESLLISDAAYASDWVNASEGFKRSIRIIMDRAQKPLFIRAAGIPLSRRSFRALCKSGYYLQKILNKMYVGEKFIQNPTQNISE